jgi:hypothetical protein
VNGWQTRRVETHLVVLLGRWVVRWLWARRWLSSNGCGSLDMDSLPGISNGLSHLRVAKAFTSLSILVGSSAVVSCVGWYRGWIVRRWCVVGFCQCLWLWFGLGFAGVVWFILGWFILRRLILGWLILGWLILGWFVMLGWAIWWWSDGDGLCVGFGDGRCPFLNNSYLIFLAVFTANLQGRILVVFVLKVMKAFTTVALGLVGVVVIVSWLVIGGFRGEDSHRNSESEEDGCRLHDEIGLVSSLANAVCCFFVKIVEVKVREGALLIELK